ncbi:MAG: cytochrome D1 domain-containing protein [Planctomycetota bacterium]
MRTVSSFALILAACSGPRVANTPPGNHLLVLNKADATLSLIETGSGVTVDQVPTGDGPHEVAVSRDGRIAVVANYGAQTPGHTLTIYDTVERVVKHTYDIAPHRRPHGIEFLDNRTTVLVTSETSKAVLEIDVRSGKVKRVLDTGAELSHMLAITPDRKRVFTANIGSNSVSAIDLASGELVKVVPTGAKPEAIAVSPDGREVWVGHNEANKIVILDARSLEIVGEIPCGPVPIRVEFTPDGRLALASAAGSGELVLIDTRERREVQRIALERLAVPRVGAQPGQDATNPLPVGIEIEPRGRFAFVATIAADRLAVIDLKERKLAGHIATGHAPDGMAWARLPHHGKHDARFD